MLLPPKSPHRSLMLVEPRLEGGTPMISEFHLGRSETPQPLTWRKGEQNGKTQAPETMQRCQNSSPSKELLRNNSTFTTTPYPSKATFVQVSGSLRCKSLVVLELGEVGEGIEASRSVERGTKATDTGPFSLSCAACLPQGVPSAFFR